MARIEPLSVTGCDRTWAVLAAEFDPRQLLDLVAAVGAYETTTFLMRAFAVDLDDDLRPG